MKKTFPHLIGLALDDTSCAQLQIEIQQALADMENAFVQDLSHISTAANYAGNMAVEQVVYLKEKLFRCDYAYDWAIGWTCSGTQEAGRIKEKVRFVFDPETGEVEFKFLQLSA